MSLAYLVSSLAPLIWGVNLEVSSVELRERVKLNLGAAAESSLLSLVAEKPISLGPKLDQWFDYKTSLDYEIALVRYKKRIGSKQRLPLHPIKFAPVHDVEEVFHAANPLLGQLSYLRLLFKEAEILETGLDWNLEFVGFYAQKLKLLEDRQSYHLELGVAALEKWADQSLKQNIGAW
ncbi:MAG: hypothetical protein QNL04_02040 [SAR324 cluster bacterium]|nr:hypothetical protein [SAR324 cluster bacterium]